MNRLRTRLRASIADGPLVLLDFISGGLDPRITFSRGSNATLVDATGKITYAPANLTLNSAPTAATWTATGGALSSGPISPDGSSLMATYTENTASSAHQSFVTSIPTLMVLGTSYTGSIYLSAGTRRYVVVNCGTNGSGWGVTVDTTNWTIASNYQVGGCTYTASAITFVGNGVYRVSVTGTYVSGGVPQSYIVVGGSLVSNATASGATYTGTGATFSFWGAQLEPVTYQTTPSTYVATTASAYYGPRFDYDPVTLAPKGLLIEEARTNLVTYSEQFDNAAWADAAPTSTVTVAANNTTAPDGTSAADKLTAATGGTNAMARQAKTLVASTAYTGSIFVKASTSTQSRLLLRDTTAGTNFADATLTWTAGVPTVAGGSVGTWAIIPFGNGWYRVTGTGTSGATASPLVTFSIFPDTAAGTNAIFVYGAQLEAGSFATSYIPTVASTVTRNADVATMTGTNFSSWYNQTEGTLVVDAIAASGLRVGAQGLFSVNDGTTSNVMNAARQAGSRVVRFNGTGSPAGDVTSVNTALDSTLLKAASAYKLNDWALSLNGATAVTDTSAVVPTATRLGIGSLDGLFDPSAQWGGHIRSIAYYNSRLSDAQLQTLTAPSLITTLSLDFINGLYDA